MATHKNITLSNLTPEQVDSLLIEANELNSIIEDASQRLEEITTKINSEVMEAAVGNLVIQGKKTSAQLVRRLNVSYPTPRGQQRLLEQLCEEAPEIMLPMVRVSFGESGQKVSNFLEKFPNLTENDDPANMSKEELVALRILQGRKVSVSKPTLKKIVNEDLENESLRLPPA